MSPRDVVPWAGAALLTVSLSAGAQSAATAPAPIPMETLASESRRILDRHCFRCHGGERRAGDLPSVRNVAVMLRDGIIVRGAPDESPLIQRLQPVGDMPLRAAPLAEHERETLRRWIRAGAPTEDAPTAAVRRQPVSELDVARAVLEDVGSLPETARPFARYFTLHHLHNAALSEPAWPQRRQGFEDALVVLLNSLSWQRNLHRVEAIQEGLVIRVDLRRLGWSAERWELLGQHYPYAARVPGDLQERAARAMGLPAGSPVTWVRADWFVAAASLSPLYDALIDLPATRAELERTLRVDVAANLRQFSAGRAGFRRSGVSRNNRVIERHETAVGAYWQSYDFIDNVGRHDVFRHPLGPGARDGEFEPSGGEIIFSLPNGLQGYMLVDGSGRRIAEAPTAIVHDATSPTDPVIHNGLSCMGCHGLDGIKPKADEVLDAVSRAGADAARVSAVGALYAQGDAWRELAQDDAARYQRALTQLLPTSGEGRASVLPVVSVARAFAAPIDAPALAAALDLSVDELTRRMESSAGELRRVAGPVLGGASLARDQLECAWPALVAEAQPLWVAPAPPAALARRCNASAARPAQPTCRTEWRQTRSFNAAVTASAWERDAGCERARADVRTRLEAVCVADGATAGSLDAVACDCQQRSAGVGRRAFWACSTTGTVACGRYEQRCVP